MMWLFGFIVALLIVVTLFFVVLPLVRTTTNKSSLQRKALNVSIYKDQMKELEADLAQGTLTEAEKQKARLELEKRLLDDVAQDEESGATSVSNEPSKRVAIVLAVAVPIFAVYLYQILGNPAGLEQTAGQHVAGSANAGGDHAVTADQIEAMVAGLAEKLKNNPDDLDGWVMLARSYSALQRYDRASFAYSQAVKLSPSDANLLVDYADALAMANNESLEGSPMSLVQRALEINPENQKGLWLMGTGEFDRGNFQEALKYWRKLQSLMVPGSPGANSIAGSIAMAEKYIVDSGGEVQPVSVSKVAQQSAVAKESGDSVVKGVVTLSADLEKSVDENAVLFVFAKPADGSRMPVAVFREAIGDFPVDFRLDDTMFLMPTARLSGYPQVQIVARVSQKGDAIPAPGDLEGNSGVIEVGTDNVAIVIDKVIP